MKKLSEFKLKLTKLILESNQVILTPHIGADCDATASCISMSLIVKKLGVPCHILINEDPLKMEAASKKISDEAKDIISIINLDTYNSIKTDKDLLITLDVNKKNLVCCESILDSFNNIILIDHHNEDDKTIITSEENKFIDTSYSSASEIMVDLLKLYNIRYDFKIATYLLAGIFLDTNRLSRNNNTRTMKTVAYLYEKGANQEIANNFFKLNFLSDRKVQDLVSKTKFVSFIFAIANGQDEEYSKEELAKAADYMLNYQTDASFAIGKIDGKLSISGRSNGKTNIGELMGQFNGGGNFFAGAGKPDINNLEELENQIIKKLIPYRNFE